MCASSCIKQYVQPSYGCRGMPVVAGMCLYCVKKLFTLRLRDTVEGVVLSVDFTIRR